MQGLWIFQLGMNERRQTECLPQWQIAAGHNTQYQYQYQSQHHYQYQYHYQYQFQHQYQYQYQIPNTNE